MQPEIGVKTKKVGGGRQLITNDDEDDDDDDDDDEDDDVDDDEADDANDINSVGEKRKYNPLCRDMKMANGRWPMANGQ